MRSNAETIKPPPLPEWAKKNQMEKQKPVPGPETDRYMEDLREDENHFQKQANALGDTLNKYAAEHNFPPDVEWGEIEMNEDFRKEHPHFVDYFHAYQDKLEDVARVKHLQTIQEERKDLLQTNVALEKKINTLETQWAMLMDKMNELKQRMDKAGKAGGETERMKLSNFYRDLELTKKKVMGEFDFLRPRLDQNKAELKTLAEQKDNSISILNQRLADEIITEKQMEESVAAGVAQPEIEKKTDQAFIELQKLETSPEQKQLENLSGQRSKLAEKIRNNYGIKPPEVETKPKIFGKIAEFFSFKKAWRTLTKEGKREATQDLDALKKMDAGIQSLKSVLEEKAETFLFKAAFAAGATKSEAFRKSGPKGFTAFEKTGSPRGGVSGSLISKGF